MYSRRSTHIIAVITIIAVYRKRKCFYNYPIHFYHRCSSSIHVSQELGFVQDGQIYPYMATVIEYLICTKYLAYLESYPDNLL